VTTRDQEEQDLRITVMTKTVEQIETDVKRKLQEIEYENRKFMVQFVIAMAAVLAAGVAIGRFALGH
jgi:hypothetical protein